MNGEPICDIALVLLLLVAMAWRMCQTLMTFGTGIPAGLFVPTLFIGACMGRLLGSAVKYSDDVYGWAQYPVEPGAYAMIGAAATLGGVCRVTISLVVIMFELTGALEYIVPFMVACQIAKWTGDWFGEGIYDQHIRLREYPFLHEPEEDPMPGQAKDIMDDDIE